ncbi:hypothetical protein POM88_037559 [Heracleum sosnowskyi]|uniref:beta-ketoacyl-[acyl-carrier-protein] synthase I n=1 Tax=Heracleum sosnowskyi TaxID=360622 RepID=A0AAD8HQB9_9APIA|nr:hypothetical protein POM88_037559 [Heracleum sosnowskyi]
MIRKEVFLIPSILRECRRIISQSEVNKEIVKIQRVVAPVGYYILRTWNSRRDKHPLGGWHIWVHGTFNLRWNVNYINAHATSTLAGDLAEAKALKKVFKNNMSEIKVNATKSMIGHCLGASAGLEGVVTVKAKFLKC